MTAGTMVERSEQDLPEDPGVYIFNGITSDINIKRVSKVIISESKNITLYINNPCSIVLKDCTGVRILGGFTSAASDFNVSLHNSTASVVDFISTTLNSVSSTVNMEYTGKMCRKNCKLLYDLQDTNIAIKHPNIDTFILSNYIDKRRGVMAFDGNRNVLNLSEFG